MRIAVLGAAGQLGRDLVPALAGEVLPLTRADADLTDGSAVRGLLDRHRPAVVVNCAAYNFVDKAEADPGPAFAVNARAVGELARACAERRIRFVQISTDYVFGLDAARTTPLTETDPPAPVSAYGASKLAGELLTLAADPGHLVVRTCGLYGVWGSGGKGGNFVETMLRVAGQGKPLRVVNDQHCTPSYTKDVAAAVAGLVAAGATGLFHVTNADACTWYELAAEAFRLSGVAADLSPITSEQFGATAKRPAYSVLSTEKLGTVGVSRPRPWREALAAYLIERRAKGQIGI